MDMRTRVTTALKQAMKDKAVARLATLRLISAAIKDQEIAARGSGGDETISDTDILTIMSKMTKQRQESARVYEEGNRLDLAERELEEIGVIEEFLPRQMDGEEVSAAVLKAVEATGAGSIRDMGKVMGVLKGKYTGQMDFSKVGLLVKDQLCSSVGSS